MTQESDKDFTTVAREHGVFFFYAGYVSQPIIEASADAIRLRLECNAVRYPTQRKLLGAFIEMAQNIVHYSAEALTAPDQTTDEMRFGTLCITTTEAGFRVACSNPVSWAVFERLESKLAVLSKMSLDEIKQTYRQALRSENENPDSKGGGIGLLTLAKDAKEPIEYSFTDLAYTTHAKNFQLSVTI
jgi:hypothetical protein